MIRLAAFAVVLAAMPAGDPAWTFASGSTLKMEVEYEKFYRVKGGAPEMEGQDAYKDELKAVLTLRVLEVAADGAATFELKVSPVRAGLGGDSGPVSSVFDSADRAKNRHPVGWAALLPELTYKLTLDARGAILKDEGFDADPHLPAVRLALLGRHLFALPAPPPAGRTANAALTVLHDLESGGQRFNLKDDTTAHDIPVSLSSAASGGGLEVTGAVAPGAKADLGKPRREFHVPGTAFTGECRGLWKDGGWVQTSWKTRGSATVKMEGKPVEVELHSRYAARRLP